MAEPRCVPAAAAGSQPAPRAAGVIGTALQALRRALVELHQKLADAERRDYERLRGRVSDEEFLAVMVSNRDFGWLGALTTLIVNLEDAQKNSARPALTRECLAQIRKLLTPGADAGEFNRKYGLILEHNAEILPAHAAVLRELQAIESALP